MPDIDKKLEQHRVEMMVKSVDLMKELRDEYMPQVKDDVVILSAAEYDHLLEKNDPNNQLAKLLNTMQKLFMSTRGCRPQLLFEGDSFVTRDKYYSKESFKSKSILKALQDYIDHMLETRKPMDITPIDDSKFDYFYPPTVEDAVMNYGKKAVEQSEST
jgi:hypothetical protein